MRHGRAVRFARHGGPEVLETVDTTLPAPGPGEVQIEQAFAGVNFIDTYHRTGLYPVPAFPAVLGVEAAGVVVAVGKGVPAGFGGQRVAYTSPLPGGYQTLRNLSADACVEVPDDIPLDLAATLMVRGMTAHYLVHDTFRVTQGAAILIHAAAGGMGLALVAWVRALGATTIIGTVSSDAKAARARAVGATHIVRYDGESVDVAAAVRAIVPTGVDAVFDGVGAATFEASLDSLRPRGVMVSYGQASGPVPPVDVAALAKRGSLWLTRPSLYHHIATTDALRMRARRVFEAVREGVLSRAIGHRYALEEAPDAHRDLEARRTTGSIVLALASQ